MRYIDLLKSCTDEEFAEIIANDDIFNMACVENYDFENDVCKHGRVSCYKCILALLQSEVTKDINKRVMQD